jgi:hypothetical protein
MRTSGFLAVAACAALCASGAKAATDEDFSSCDGYGPPKGKSDGISKSVWLWGLAARPDDIRRQGLPDVGEGGLAACDRALTDPRLKDTFWLRRANLLQGKAVHALAASHPDLAIELADQSDQLGSANQGGPYFARSTGAGNLAVRAYALTMLERRNEARQAIDALVARRQWSQSIRQLAVALDAQLDTSVAASVARLRSAIPLHPRLARNLFWTQFLEGSYEDAAATYPTLDFSPPNMRGAWSLSDEDRVEAQALEERSSVIGATAYAEATLGRGDDARALIAAGVRAAEAALTPPAPRANGKPPRRSEVEAFNRRRPYATRAKQALGQWQKAVEFRLGIGGQPLEAVQSRFSADKLAELPILPDVFSHLAGLDASLKPDIDRAIEQYRAIVENERIAASKLSVATLLSLLPRPETADAVPVLKPAGDGYFLTDTGLSREREGETDVWTIRYTHKVAPIAADEELAMLGAAQTGQKLGFDSFVILNTSFIARTTNISGMYTGSYSVNSGYEAQLRVRFVHAGELAAEMQPMAWRLISAQQVIEQLGTRYQSSNGVTIAF